MHNFGTRTDGKKIYSVYRMENGRAYQVYKTPVAKDGWRVFYRYSRTYRMSKRYALVMRSYDDYGKLQSQRIVMESADIFTLSIGGIL